MKNKKLIIIFGIIIGIFLTAAFFYKDSLLSLKNRMQDHQNNTDIIVENPYNADSEITLALEQLKKSQERATVIRGNKGGSRTIALTFDGLTDRTTLQQILGLLQKYNVKATFFANGIQVVEEPQLVADITKAGQKVENFTLVGMAKMEELPVDRLVQDFCRAKKIIKQETAQEPNLLKCNDTKYTDKILQVAKACGFKSVVQSDVFLNVKQVNSPAAADAFVAALQPGSIVSVKLITNIDPFILGQGKNDEKPAIDKQPSIKEMPAPLNQEEKETVLAVEQLLIALQKAKYSSVYVDELVNKTVSFLKEQIMPLFFCQTAYAAENGRQPATEMKMIFTTEQALSYTFGGLAKETVVDDVLEKLNKLGIKATFFVAETEMKKYPQTIKKIISSGHEIGIAIRPKDGATFEETSNSLVRSSRILKENFGVTTNLVKQVSGVITDTTKEAVGSLDYYLIGQSMNVVQSKHKDYTSVDAIMTEVFPKSKASLARGQILYFKMDFYTDNQIIGGLMETIKHNKIDNIAYATFYDNPDNNRANDSQYMIKPVGEILNNHKMIYKYPGDREQVPAYLQAESLEFATIDHHKFLSELTKRYIGQSTVNIEDRMLGFSKMEARRLDRNGCIHTKDNVIFLTFDDWGSDSAINKLLYVLRKHNVTGTFFIITNNLANNPNLLRAIAQEGHEIGDHSDKHKPMVITDPQTGKFVSPQTKEEYTQELATSYDKLLEVTGDVTFKGKPVLTKYFRPPTLAISKVGMESVLGAGYEYIVSGSTSTEDYMADNVGTLIAKITEGIFTADGEVQKGAILVMHMSDAAKYTATAVDILLTANEAKADSDPSKFKVGRLSDYLVNGYSQINQKQH